MKEKLKLLAISGSTRQQSSNLNLIKAIAELSAEFFSMTIYNGLSEIPSFNPDLDNENAPEPVRSFRQTLRAADAVLICTPEYAVGVPGSLKNAVDWTVSSMEFSQKPVALITASTSGFIAHQSLLGTLLIIEARITSDTQLVIPHVKTKVTNERRIVHEETLNKVNKLLETLAAAAEGAAGLEYLPAPRLM